MKANAMRFCERFSRRASFRRKPLNLLGISRRAIHYKIKKYGIECGKRSGNGDEGD